MDHADRVALEAVGETALRLTGSPEEYDGLLELIGDARFVLLGEASHGTHEFYQSRAEITRRLIEEKDFAAVAVEADWPDAYRVNRFVRGWGDDNQAIEALGNFRRFPLWMWRNTEVLDFIGWLRERNQGLAEEQRSGFYGLDLYSLHASIEAVINYLVRIDPQAAEEARRHYACLDHAGREPQYYGYDISLGTRPSCQDEVDSVVGQLMVLRQRAADDLERGGLMLEDEQFHARQNALLVRNAEEYYRCMFDRRVNTWNLRDRHMSETLSALADHLSRRGQPARIVVWEHNSHIGDARATEMGTQGELNVGQLTREQYGNDAVLIGFTTYTGTVSAASDWDGPVERKRVRPALAGSYEALFHQTGMDRFWLHLRQHRVAQALRESRLERAIGVIYRPESERISHYFHSRLSEQFDAVLHFDETRAVEPLDPTSEWERGEELPETYPYGV